MTDYIINVSASRPIISNDLTMSQEFRAWVQTISNHSLIIGEGSPEGIIAAFIGAEYMDSNGSSGSVKYIKQANNIAGDRSKGWILI